MNCGNSPDPVRFQRAVESEHPTVLKNKSRKAADPVVRIQFGMALAILIIDQTAKWMVLLNLQPYTAIEVTRFFNLVLIYNKGAAFGFLAQSNFDVNLFFLLANLIILVFLLYALRALCPPRSQSATAIWLIIGGAVGNLTDRIVHGHVIDFLDFHYAGWHYSAFNVADSAITIGAVLIAMEIFGLRILFRRSQSPDSSSPNR